MNPVTETVLVVAALVSVGFGGYCSYPQLNKTAAQPVVVTKTVTKTITEPGKTIEIVKEKRVPVNTPVAAKRNDYSLGIKSSLTSGDLYPVEVQAGRRLFGDFWATIEANWKNHDLLLGVSYEF